MPVHTLTPHSDFRLSAYADAIIAYFAAVLIFFIRDDAGAMFATIRHGFADVCARRFILIFHLRYRY